MHCRQATKIISDAQERPLQHREQIALRLHLIICPYCRRFKRNCSELSKIMKDFKGKA